MTLRAASVLLCAALLGAERVVPDFGKLTDFRTDFTFDTRHVVRAEAEITARDHLFPTLAEAGAGTLKLDAFGERLDIAIPHMTARFATDPEVVQGRLPAFLLGAGYSGSSRLTFLPGAAVVWEEATLTPVQMPPFSLRYCVKLHFARGLLPPGRMLKAMVDSKKPEIEQMLNAAPHQYVTVDNETVALYSGGSPGGLPAYVGLHLDASIAGLAVVPPKDGSWKHILLKFSGWTKGAGEIQESSCGEGAGAAELAAAPQAGRALAVFDSLLAGLQGAEPYGQVLRAFPAKPSLLFEGAEAAPTAAAAAGASTPAGAVLAAVAGAGALGSLLTLAISRATRAHSSEPLLYEPL
uniref:Uncharacterized protein n=1 Tax=Alexandrium catenella TaxID=2925 RepID=A0A7S1QE51_ALECA|mmetsp:Transcript_29404/g.79396  ORF Transcript_29404/g.79396 Transcript_29404/m.79396 type:complete len:352 (+) Transcript_29404:77-1132(+)